MKSKIDLSEKVENKDRRFGSTLEYYPAMVDDVPALFTADQIEEAKSRAAINPEDIPGETFWGKLFG